MMKNLLLVLAMSILFGNMSYAEDFAIRVYQEKSKSVVFIVARTGVRSPVAGAGSVISDSGIIVTNAHVVVDKNTSRPFANIKVYIKPDQVTGSYKKDLVYGYKAVVKQYDVDLDIAIIKIEDLPTDIQIIELADPGAVQIGEAVVAIGHPEQGGFWTLTYGRISGEIFNQKGIEGKDVYQTDTSVNRGNSGGPLLDKNGHMVGINTSIARLGAGNLPITGVNFALKSNVVKKWLETQDIMLSYGAMPHHKDTKLIKVKGEREIPQDTVKEEREIPQDTVKEEREIPQDTVISPEKPYKKDTILTKKRPYKIDNLFKEVEIEMEDMMEEMRGSIKNK